MTPACFPSSGAFPPLKHGCSTLLVQTRITTTLIISSASSSPQPAAVPPPQRSPEWFALRRDKLTTSAFSTALGFWKGNRRAELWQQKVFFPDASNISIDVSAMAAMQWGVEHEAAAVESYQQLTGREVSFLGFAVHANSSSSWMGASPDGILAGGGIGTCIFSSGSGGGGGGGILEVKCPYNRGRPHLGLPWREMPYYYMPQVQGQMEIMDREWVDLYCWTPNGSSLFRVHRERGYWDLMHGVLREFWWENVVPAREELAAGREEAARKFEPEPRHELTSTVVAQSRKLAAASKLLCKEVAGHVEFFG